MEKGHAYNRAYRAHLLTHAAIADKVFSLTELSDDEEAYLCTLINKLGPITRGKLHSSIFQSIVSKFYKKLEELENFPTGKLWAQYFYMVTILKQFVEGNRSGNFDWHLESLKKMLPIFVAAGHYNYAKSVALHIQDLHTYAKECKGSPEFKDYTDEGFFTIHRTDKFWSGIASDQTIEQTFMGCIKANGGLTRGRGMKTSTIAKYIKTVPVFATLAEQLESFCGLYSTSSDQQVDSRDSRIELDRQHLQLMREFLELNDPFVPRDCIMSIATGVKGDSSVNCHYAFTIGLQVMEKKQGTNFSKLSFQKKDYVVTLAKSLNTVKFQNEEIVVDQKKILHRLIVGMGNDGNLKLYLSYELAACPLSLFLNGIMRKNPNQYFTRILTICRRSQHYITLFILLTEVTLSTLVSGGRVSLLMMY